MFQFISAILLIVGFLLLIYYFSVLNNHYKNLSIYRILSSDGFEFDPNFEQYIKNIDRAGIFKMFRYSVLKDFIVSKEGITFDVREVLSQKNDVLVSMFEIQFAIPWEIRTDLVIKKRSILNKVFGFNKGDFPDLSNDLSIKCSNVILVNSLLSDPEFRNVLHDILLYTNRIDFQQRITLTTEKNSFQLSDALNRSLNLIKSIKNILGQINDENRYRMKEINIETIMKFGNFNCIICRRDIQIDQLYILDCCGSSVYGDHIKSWLTKEERCPYCRKLNVHLLVPKIH